MTKRPTNQELCMSFRELLTGKTVDVFNGIVEEHGELLTPDDLLERTKPWRGEMWKAFRAIEERMCPTPEIARRYVKEAPKCRYCDGLGSYNCQCTGRS